MSADQNDGMIESIMMIMTSYKLLQPQRCWKDGSIPYRYVMYTMDQ